MGYMGNGFTPAAAGLLLAISLGPALAGDNNQVFVSQQSPAGTTHGNSLTIDQFAATDSLVRGLNVNLTGWLGLVALNALGNDPLLATQRGEGNSATLTLTGVGGELQLFQSSAPSATWLANAAAGNNIATMTAAAGALGGVAQIGSENRATLNLEPLARGLIVQNGTGLRSDLSVGTGGSGQVMQIGNNSTTGTVTVPANSSLIYTQIGNGIGPVAGGVEVLFSSNPGTIIVTQTGW